jgi:DNA-binding beta-propeller fold protein YncE
MVKLSTNRVLGRLLALAALAALLALTSTRLRADSGVCGGGMVSIPFSDVPSTNIFFCSIAEAYFSGLTFGTTATTYSPADPVPREQMSAFITRTMDQSVKRSSRRAALNQYWTIQNANTIALTTVGSSPKMVQSDGSDLWVTNNGSGTVSRIRASDGRLLETWTSANNAWGVLCAIGKVFVTTNTVPGLLYQIDPTQPQGPVSMLSNGLGGGSIGIAFDGQKIWTANISPGSVSIITLNPTMVTNVPAGFTSLLGIIFDGSNIWVSDNLSGSVDQLHKLDSTGNILLSVDVGSVPESPAFDGTNIWVPDFSSNSVSVVRATGGLTGTVLATLSGNGLNGPIAAAYDGERILVMNSNGDSVSLWNATDLTPIGTFSTGAGTRPGGACSDGLNFWLTFQTAGKLARF